MFGILHLHRLRRVTLRSARLAVIACVIGTAADGFAQSTTHEDARLFPDEARFLHHRTCPPFADLVVDSAYEDLAAPPFGPDRSRQEACAVRAPLDAPIPIPGPYPFGVAHLDDPSMQHFLAYYQGEGRRRAAGWWASAGRYRERIAPILAEHGAPEELLWVVAVESAFDPTQVSRAGAAGLWQLMPRTARAYGLRVDGEVDERLDPEASTRAALAHFDVLHARYGHWLSALAAYNAGHVNISGGIREVGVTNFWELDDYEVVFSAAHRYALRVLTMALVDAHPDAFGLQDRVAERPVAFETVDVPGNVRLSVLAEAAGVGTDELLALNPALVARRTPRDVEQWPLRLPPGSRSTFVRAYDRLATTGDDAHRVVTLQVGEDLGALADRVGAPERVLRAINGFAYDADVAYGTEVMVPERYRAAPPRAPAARTIVLPPAPVVPRDRALLYYETTPIDRPALLAEAFGVSIWDLCAWNDLDPEAALPAGAVLRVWVRDVEALDAVRTLDASTLTVMELGSPEHRAWLEAEEREQRRRRRRYTVQSGDTLSGIADRFDVDVDDLLRWNNISDARRIRPGQELDVSR